MKRLLNNFTEGTSGFVLPIIVLVGVFALLRAAEDITLLGVGIALGFLAVLYVLGFLMKGAGWRAHGPD